MKKIILIVLVLAGSLSANAQKPAVIMGDDPGWRKIGEVTADFKVEKDAISVMGADKFRAIKLKVTDASINLYDLDVYYESGEKENIKVDQNLTKGQETRVITLKDKTREVKRVEFIYKTAPNARDEKAHVELYGLK